MIYIFVCFIISIWKEALSYDWHHQTQLTNGFFSDKCMTPKIQQVENEYYTLLYNTFSRILTQNIEKMCVWLQLGCSFTSKQRGWGLVRKREILFHVSSAFPLILCGLERWSWGNPAKEGCVLYFEMACNSKHANTNSLFVYGEMGMEDRIVLFLSGIIFLWHEGRKKADVLLHMICEYVRENKYDLDQWSTRLIMYCRLQS